jgi:hypothetical protein
MLNHVRTIAATFAILISFSSAASVQAQTTPYFASVQFRSRTVPSLLREGHGFLFAGRLGG